MGGLGFPQPGKPSVESREDEGGQQRLRGRGATAPGDMGGLRDEVGPVRVVKNNTLAD